MEALTEIHMLRIEFDKAIKEVDYYMNHAKRCKKVKDIVRLSLIVTVKISYAVAIEKSINEIKHEMLNKLMCTLPTYKKGIHILKLNP